MCDTLTALAGETARGFALFAKNSDRERNEAQFLEMTPRARHAPGTEVAATYLAIPQVAETNACLLSRPFWMWGAEMGANEHGVVIGNEAMHAKVPAQRRRALIGMDLVRLGLERAATAAGAVEVITGLLERHGQGGDCGHLGRFYYHNGFIVADAREAYVLETVGRWWIVERVDGVRALSNALSIGPRFERAGADLVAHAAAQGWSGADGRFDFAAALIDEARDAVSFGRGRCARGTELLNRRRGALTPQDMMAILRDHGPEGEANPGWTPADTLRRTICMHAAQGPRRSQSVGAMVSELRPGGAVHWMTATSAPCLSLFKPVLFGTALPDQGPRPGDRYDGESLWWRRERLHRAALADFAGALAAVAPERDALERAFAEQVDQALADEDPQGRERAVADCWRAAGAAEERWRTALAPAGPAGPESAALRRSWARLSHVAAMPKL
jgi:secernin